MTLYCIILSVIVILDTVVIWRLKHRTDGELLIDTSNPEKDIYRLELGKNFELLEKKKNITLKVVHGVDLTN